MTNHPGRTVRKYVYIEQHPDGAFSVGVTVGKPTPSNESVRLVARALGTHAAVMGACRNDAEADEVARVIAAL